MTLCAEVQRHSTLSYTQSHQNMEFDEMSDPAEALKLYDLFTLLAQSLTHVFFLK